MAIKKTVVIDVDADKAIKDTEKLKDNLKGIDKEADNVGDGLNNAGKKGSKGVRSISKAFKLLGTAMKAAGIGLIISLVAGLTSAFSKNQRIMNTVNSVFETASILFANVTDALLNVYDSVSANSENFNGLKKVMLGLLNLAVTPLKLQFYAIKQAIQVGQLAWEKSFFGGGDKDKIKELTNDIKETQKSIQETANKALQSGKDIYNNFGDAVGEITTIAGKANEELSKISIKSAYEQAKTNTELKNTAQLAVAQQQRLVEQYDRLAEKERQVRDDNSLSVQERTEANDKLLQILDKQEKAMLAGADAQIAAASAELAKNRNIENQVALTDALANKEGILAQIEGFRSEQIVNRIALKKEEIDLDNTISDAEKQRQLDKLDFEAEIAENELLKNEKLQERLELENEILLEDIERKREIYAEGTQARVDAEQEYLDAMQELAQKEILLNNKVAEQNIKNAVAEAESKKSIQDNYINTVGQGINLLSALGEKSKGLQAASIIAENVGAIAKTISNTTVANAKAVAASPLTAGQPFVGLNIASAGIGIASSIAATAKGLSQLGQGGSGGGGSLPSLGASQPSAPSFNLVQGTGTNQIAESIGNQNRPIQAYVVSGSVTSAQELDRNIVESSTI